MQPQVKVTNISHRNGSGFGLWLAQRYIKPGSSVVMPVAELPGDYTKLSNVLEFEFLQATVPIADPNTELVMQMLDMQKALLEQMGQMQERINQQSQQVVVVQAPVGNTAAPSGTAPLGIGTNHFIPEIGEVQADIQISSTSSKAVDGKALKERLKKAKKSE